MTGCFVVNLEVLLNLFPFIAECRVGKNSLSSALLPPDLPGGDHPGHPRLVVLRLAVHDLVGLTVGDEDTLSHLSVQTGFEGALHLEGEGLRVGQPLRMFYLEVFYKGILAVICLDTVPVLIDTMVSVVSRLSEVNCLHSVLLTHQTFPAVYTASSGMGASSLPTVTEVTVRQETPR